MLKKIILFSIPLFFLFSSCKKDQLLTDGSAKLDFSADTVLFDTVFTTLGSVTKVFHIYNHHNQPLNISNIHLLHGTDSQFKINVDGTSGTSLNDIEILANDSMWVFVQVTLDILNQNNPLLIEEQIIFETNGNMQQVYLVAVGQDAYIHKPDHFPTNGFPDYSFIGCNETWTNDKPHLIFGYAVVDSACTLTMMPGTRVHLYNSSTLYVYRYGTLKIMGELNNEVTFQGMRLEPDYKDIPGQWGRIWLSNQSKDNEVNWAIIKNGSIGIHADSMPATGTTPTVVIANTIIKNMQVAGLYAQTAHVYSYNCVFANCGYYSAALSIGGSYKFLHCTFANYWNTYTNAGINSNATLRDQPLIVLNNHYLATDGITYVYDLDSAYFGNCIFYGDLDNEMALDSLTGTTANFNYKFENCLIKTTINTGSTAHFPFCITNQDPIFKDISANDYQLNSSLSPAKDAGGTSLLPPIADDLKGYPRTADGYPDIGAYEWHL